MQVLVKDIKEKVLPDVTDEWAGEASEFDTVEELRADIIKRMTMVKRLQAGMALNDGVVAALVELVDIDPPAALVDAETERRANELGERLSQQGATIEQYLEATGESAEHVVGQLRTEAIPAVKADLALRAVAEAEAITVGDEDIDAQVERLAERHSMKAAEVRRNLERADQMPALRSDIKKSKALEWLVEQVELVDDEGHPVDRSLLGPEAILGNDAEDAAAKDETAVGDESKTEAGTVSASSESGEA